MNRTKLYAGILGLQDAYLSLTHAYHNNLVIGDVVSIKHQKEIIRALFIYIQVLHYYYLGFEDPLNDSVKRVIDDTLGESMRLISMFKNSYYV